MDGTKHGLILCTVLMYAGGSEDNHKFVSHDSHFSIQNWNWVLPEKHQKCEHLLQLNSSGYLENLSVVQGYATSCWLRSVFSYSQGPPIGPYSQPNPSTPHLPQPFFFIIHLNITFPPVHTSSKWSLIPGFLVTVLYKFHISLLCDIFLSHSVIY